MKAHRLHLLKPLENGIPDLASLHEHLQIALELELSTLPPYLCALYSIPDGSNREVAGLIRSVLMEEMLHLSLVANLINATGGTPRLTSPDAVLHYPTTLPDSDGSFTVHLLPFSQEAIATFMRIEQPAAADAPAQADHYNTIGQFYQAIAEALTRLSDAGLVRFDQQPERQIAPADFYNGHGNIIVVNSLTSAQQAIREICDQGEGAHHGILEGDQPLDALGYDLAHYYRFMEIAKGRRFQAGDSPASGPTGPMLPVDWSAARPMIRDPKIADQPAQSPAWQEMNACNQTWWNLLQSLEQGFQGSRQSLQQAVPWMMDLKNRVIQLMNLPAAAPGSVLGPSFEKPLP
jgi:hypothetical protein